MPQRCLLPKYQTRPDAQPIKTYNSVQTWANNQFGGEKKGLVKPAYQETITGWVTLLERNPTATDSTIPEIIASISFDF